MCINEKNKTILTNPFKIYRHYYINAKNIAYMIFNHLSTHK